MTASRRDELHRRALAAVRSIRARLAKLLRPPAHLCAAHEDAGYYAQFSEDRMLEEIFANQAQGYCVEVGAYDGRTGSASYLFEQKGWTCLLVEPIPELVEEIRRNRRCVVRQVAVSSREGEETFYRAENVEQMSTLVLAPDHHRWISEVGGVVREITVPTTTLTALLDDVGFPRIDFITIDVEGHELDVLRGFALDKHRPRIVIVEDNSQQRSSDVTEHMASSGYVHFKRTGVNDWYADESDAELIQADAVKRFEREKSRDRLVTSVTRHLPAWAKRGLNALSQYVARGT